MAIKEIWPPYSPGTPWSMMPIPHQHLLVSKSSSAPGLQTLHLQYNLVSGRLLVNGSPLSTLPSNFQLHETYRRLFRDQIVKVMPSTLKGMTYSTTSRYCGHEVHFGMFDDDLVIRSRKNDKTYELIPTKRLHGDLPLLMLSNYAHWLVVGEQKIEFRPLDNAWQTFENWHSSEGLVLAFEKDGTARLAKIGSGKIRSSISEARPPTCYRRFYDRSSKRPSFTRLSITYS
jgi:hypothetical protein